MPIPFHYDRLATREDFRDLFPALTSYRKVKRRVHRLDMVNGRVVVCHGWNRLMKFIRSHKDDKVAVEPR